MASEGDWDGLAWLQYVPRSSWPIPEDIKGPTRVPTTNVLIAILSEDRIGNDIVAAVGDLLAEEARFNVWYAKRVRGRVPPEYKAPCPRATEVSCSGFMSRGQRTDKH